MINSSKIANKIRNYKLNTLFQECIKDSWKGIPHWHIFLKFCSELVEKSMMYSFQVHWGCNFCIHYNICTDLFEYWGHNQADKSYKLLPNRKISIQNCIELIVRMNPIELIWLINFQVWKHMLHRSVRIPCNNRCLKRHKYFHDHRQCIQLHNFNQVKCILLYLAHHLYNLMHMNHSKGHKDR